MSVLTVWVVAERCVRSRWVGAECDRCEACCPDAAIVWDPGPHVSEACTGCGACVAACPTDVFVAADGDEASLGARLAEVAEDGRGTVVCARAERPAGPALELGCLGRLSVDALVHAGTSGVAHVDARSASCAGCDRRDAVRFLRETADLAAALAGASGATLAVEHTRADAESAEHGRRKLLGGALTRLAAAPAQPSRARTRRTAKQRRAAMLRRLRAAAPPAAAPPPGGHWPFGRIDVDPATCTGCPACERMCPTEAIRCESFDGGAWLSVQQDRCTGCGACVAACAAGAIGMRAASPWEVVGPEAVTETVVRRGTCHVCGQPSDAPDGVACKLCWRIEHPLGAARSCP